MKFRPAFSSRFKKTPFLDLKNLDPFIRGTPAPKPPPPQIPYSLRDQHVYIPGKTRHGKSTQLLHMIMRDINNKQGVGVLDPKGDLIRKVCALMPEERIKDCIYLDLKSRIPLDVMQHADNPESLVGDIKGLVLKGDTTLKRAEPILTRLVYSLLKISGTCFTDIEAFFINRDRKKAILNALKLVDENRWQYWENNFPGPEEYRPLVARMTDFTQNDSLYQILSEPDPYLKIPKAMNDRRIVLVDLGGTGEAQKIYGTLLVSQFQQAALGRHHLEESEIVPFHLFVDEFEEFQTSSFAQIFSVAGGFGLRLTIGNQYIGQLTETIHDAVFGNVGSYIIFKIGNTKECSLFKHACSPYHSDVVGQLRKWEAVYKIGDEPPVITFSAPPPKIKKQRGEEIIAKLIDQTQEEFGPRNAKSGPNRTVDILPLHSPAVPQTEGDGNTDTKAEPEKGGGPTPPEFRKTR